MMMNNGNISRRSFVKNSALATLGAGILPSEFAKAGGSEQRKIKVGVIGTGNRGTSHVRNLLQVDGCEIVAVCDLFQSRADNAADICVKAGKKRPKVYCKTETTWTELIQNEKNLDAVIIASYWEYHAAMALYAMKYGVIAGVEVPAALTLDETWSLVDTAEKTGTPFMMLENWSFRKDNLALLNMKRLGMLGEIVHCHCAHSHDCVDHWFFDPKTGEDRWAAKYLIEYDRNQYPTHAVGPVLSWMDINCGDTFTEIYTVSSASKGISAYINRKFGSDHPNAKINWRQGDIVTSLLKTKMGKTLVINYDMQLPRPYANRWMLQGTLGVYDEEKSSVYIVDKSPEYHEWEPWKPYEEKYDHKFWNQKDTAGSHGGVDFVMLTQFVEAIRSKKPLPIDIYDSAVMSALVELSGLSIAKNAPVPFPDFTRGAWKDRKPFFAMDQTS